MPDDLENPPLSARILEVNSLPWLNLREPFFGNRQRRICVRGHGAAGARGRQPDTSRLNDSSQAVAVRMPDYHLRTWFDIGGSELRPREIHQYAARLAEFETRAFKMIDHPGPNLGRVVRAIDAHTVHPVGHEIAHQRIVIGRL